MISKLCKNPSSSLHEDIGSDPAHDQHFRVDTAPGGYTRVRREGHADATLEYVHLNPNLL